MNILRKLSVLTRGSVRETAQVIIDKNGHRIMDQEIVDIEKSILAHKNTLAELLASKKQLSRESNAVKALITKREAQARRLMSNDENSGLVDDIIQEIAGQEVTLERLGNIGFDTERRILKLEGILNKAVLEVANYRRELRVSRAQHIHGTGALDNRRGLNQRFTELKATHDRLVAVNEHQEDCDAAWGEMDSRLGSGSIDSRLEALDESDHQLRTQEILKRLQDD